jgi:hypothetical protein
MSVTMMADGKYSSRDQLYFTNIFSTATIYMNLPC